MKKADINIVVHNVTESLQNPIIGIFMSWSSMRENDFLVTSVTLKQRNQAI